MSPELSRNTDSRRRPAPQALRVTSYLVRGHETAIGTLYPQGGDISDGWAENGRWPQLLVAATKFDRKN